MCVSSWNEARNPRARVFELQQRQQQTKETKGQGVSTPFPEANFRRSSISEAAE